MCFFLLLAAVLGLARTGLGQRVPEPDSCLPFLWFWCLRWGLSMFGVFNLPVLDLKAVPAGSAKLPARAGIFTGMMATLLATPCSGPFLGGRAGLGVSCSLRWCWGRIRQCRTGHVFTVSHHGGVSRTGKALSPTGQLDRYTRTPRRLFLMGTTVYLLRILPETLWPSMLVLLWITGLAAWVWGRFSGLGKIIPPTPLCASAVCNNCDGCGMVAQSAACSTPGVGTLRGCPL